LRLVSDTTHTVDTTWWAFVVLAVVITVDASRALVSMRTARRYHSVALASIVLVAAARLARQSIEVLMDRADADSEAAVRAAIASFGDIELRRLRSRHA